MTIRGRWWQILLIKTGFNCILNAYELLILSVVIGIRIKISYIWCLFGLIVSDFQKTCQTLICRKVKVINGNQSISNFIVMESNNFLKIRFTTIIDLLNSIIRYRRIWPYAISSIVYYLIKISSGQKMKQSENPKEKIPSNLWRAIDWLPKNVNSHNSLSGI